MTQKDSTEIEGTCKTNEWERKKISTGSPAMSSVV